MKLQRLLNDKTLQMLSLLGHFSLEQGAIEQQFVERGYITLPVSFHSSSCLVVKPVVEKPKTEQTIKKPSLRPPTTPSDERMQLDVPREGAEDDASKNTDPVAWTSQERKAVTAQLWDVPLQGYVEFVISSNVTVTQFRYEFTAEDDIASFGQLLPILVQFLNARECFCSSYVCLHIPDTQGYYQRHEFFEYILRGHRGEVVQKLCISCEQTNATTYLVRSMIGGDPATLPDVAAMIAEFVTSLTSAKSVTSNEAATNEATSNEAATNEATSNEATVNEKGADKARTNKAQTNKAQT